MNSPCKLMYFVILRQMCFAYCFFQFVDQNLIRMRNLQGVLVFDHVANKIIARRLIVSFGGVCDHLPV